MFDKKDDKEKGLDLSFSLCVEVHMCASSFVYLSVFGIWGGSVQNKVPLCLWPNHSGTLD